MWWWGGGSGGEAYSVVSEDSVAIITPWQSIWFESMQHMGYMLVNYFRILVIL